MVDRNAIVLVTVDCLRADHCGFIGYARPTTPFLDRLACESLILPAAIAAGVPTYYSVPSILTSRSPLAFGREVVGLCTGEPTLASTLRESGYATAFFGAANPYISAHFGYDQGFDTFEDFLDHGLTPVADPASTLPSEDGWSRRLNRALDQASHGLGVGAAYDELYFQYCQRWAAPPPGSLDALRRFPAADVIVDRALTWLASVGNRPCFLWLHLMDPHSPYYPTASGQELFEAMPTSAGRARYVNAYWSRPGIAAARLRGYRDEIVALYDSGIRWVDAQLQRLVDGMRQSQLWNNCIFALTADHGEEFLEHEGRYHPPSSLAEELIHVPLLLRVPRAEKKEQSKSPFSLLDLAPTILDAAALPIPPEFQGQSRWQQIREGKTWTAPAIAECISGCTNPFRQESRRGPRILAVREERYKLVLNFEHSTAQLFDLESDPSERTPLHDTAGKPERRRLLQAALEHLQKPVSRSSTEYMRTRLRDIELPLAKSALTTAVTQMNRAGNLQ